MKPKILNQYTVRYQSAEPASGNFDVLVRATDGDEAYVTVNDELYARCKCDYDGCGHRIRGASYFTIKHLKRNEYRVTVHFSRNI